MPHQPNVLIFMTDMLQSQVIHPDHPCQMPNVEKLQQQGVTFENAYTPAAHCCPSRATFFTGLYPCQHGIFNNIHNGQAINTCLYPGIRTFGENLKDAGYELAYDGKWHVSNDRGPKGHGWEELLVTQNAGIESSTEQDWKIWKERAQKMAKKSDSPRRPGEINRPGWPDYNLYGTMKKPVSEHIEGQITAAAIQAIPKLVAQEKPWCLYVGIPDQKFFVPQRILDLYDPDQIPLPQSYHDRMEDKPRVYQRQRREVWDRMSEQEVKEGIRHYWAYFTMIDELFGDIMSTLDESGAAEVTVVIFLSDHGNYAGAHGLWGLGVGAFDEVYRIPLVVRWPQGAAEPGGRVDSFVSLADLAPTILDIAGCGENLGLTGQSLVPWLQGETPLDWRDAFYSQFNGVELYYSQRIIKTKQYKYVYNGFDFDELYDIQNDPYELVNLAERSDMDGVKHKMVNKMWKYAKNTGDTMYRPAPWIALAPYGPMDIFNGEFDDEITSDGDGEYEKT